MEEDPGKKEELDEMELQLLDKPMSFNPIDPANVLISAENSFEEVCATLQENGVNEPKQLTEFEFYSRLRYYEKKFKAQKDAGKRQ